MQLSSLKTISLKNNQEKQKEIVQFTVILDTALRQKNLNVSKCNATRYTVRCIQNPNLLNTCPLKGHDPDFYQIIFFCFIIYNALGIHF